MHNRHKQNVIQRNILPSGLLCSIFRPEEVKHPINYKVPGKYKIKENLRLINGPQVVQGIKEKSH